MKQIITIVLYLLLPISIYSQDYDLKDAYIKGINNSLDSGDCKHAELVYKVAIENKVLKADADIEARIADCKNSAKATQAPQQTYQSLEVANEIDLIKDLEKDELVYVEGGSFLMGAQNSYSPTYDWQGVQTSNSLNYDSDAHSYESAVHKVTLSGYYIGKYEVTQQLWEYVMNYSGETKSGTVLRPVGTDAWFGNNPSSEDGKGKYYPAYYVSYEDIVNYFLPRLNKITGKNYRLPTEAEWEYAARGGQKNEYTRTHPNTTADTNSTGTYYKYSGSNRIDNVAWYYENSGLKTHPVGTKQANELGIYDMSGNVSEWCSDWHGSYLSTSQTNPTGPSSGSYRVHRGGSWGGNAELCRVSARNGGTPSDRIHYLGFRVALSL